MHHNASTRRRVGSADEAGSVYRRAKDSEIAARKQEVGMGLARAELQHECAALQRSRAALGAETIEFSNTQV